MPYTLAYADRYIRKQHPLTLTNAYECEPEPFKPLNKGLNSLMLRITDKEFTKLWSAMLAGAELLFPDDVNTLQMILHQAIGCPIELEDEGGCFNYLPYASFISFYPQNPYSQPDYVPDGYAFPPFLVNSTGEYVGYDLTDILVPFAAINLDPIDIFTGDLPQIQIRVRGTGQIELDLLAVQSGGYAILKLDSPPNILDIISGIIDPEIRIIDLEADIVSLPPETDIVVAEEYDIVSENPTDEHTLYITFFPKINDTFIPLSFGGGLRRVGLCGLEIAGEEFMVSQIRLEGCEIQALINGEWQTQITEEDLRACFDESSQIENLADDVDEVEDIQSGGYNPANATKPVNEGKNATALGNDVYSPSSGCDDTDKDKLWASISGLIDYWHSRNLQLLNEFSGVAGLQQAINIMLIAVPIYNVLNSALKSSFANWMILQARNAYQSQVTTPVLNELKCDLFCAAVDNGCAINMQAAIDEIISNGLSFTMTDNIVDLFTELASFSGADAKEWFAAIAILQASLATLGEQSITTVGLQSFLNAANAASESPSKLWQVYCDECASPSTQTIVFDFAGTYNPLAGEIVYRPPFTLGENGAQSTGAVHRFDYGQGLYLASGNTIRRQLEFLNTVTLNSFVIGARSIPSSDPDSTWRLEDGTFPTTTIAKSATISEYVIGGGVTRSNLNMVSSRSGSGSFQSCYISYVKCNVGISSEFPKLA